MARGSQCQWVLKAYLETEALIVLGPFNLNFKSLQLEVRQAVGQVSAIMFQLLNAEAHFRHWQPQGPA
jgi:hypothetical protein